MKLCRPPGQTPGSAAKLSKFTAGRPPAAGLSLSTTTMTKPANVRLAIFQMSASKVVLDGALFRQHGARNTPQRPPKMIRLSQLQRPLQAVAVAGSCRPTLATFALPSRPTVQSTPAQTHPADCVVEGRRYASVKSQGAYRIPNKKTIAKKLGAKKSGGTFMPAVAPFYRLPHSISEWHADRDPWSKTLDAIELTASSYSASQTNMSSPEISSSNSEAQCGTQARTP